MRSLFAPLAVCAVALAASVARWLWQGGRVVYTDADRKVYLPDPDLGWRMAERGIAWLGADALGALAGVTAGILVAALIVRWRERKVGRAWRLGRGALWVGALATLAVPAWAFGRGGLPAGARTSLPEQGAVVATGEVGGRLAARPGRWTSVPHGGTRLTASIAAGGERFDARFPLEATIVFDPGDLRQPLIAEFVADATGIDTGVDMRSKHAREYLAADRFPALSFKLTRVLGARQDGPDQIAFSAEGAVSMMGAELPVAASGTLRLADDAARARLGVTAPEALVLQATLPLDVRATPMAKDAGDFDSSEIRVTASAVMVRHPQEESR